jgi:hypothetical protein
VNGIQVHNGYAAAGTTGAAVHNARKSFTVRKGTILPRGNGAEKMLNFPTTRVTNGSSNPRKTSSSRTWRAALPNACNNSALHGAH